jgi:hypothetical protein
VGLSPRRAAARETLDVYRSGSLRGFVLVGDQGIKFSWPCIDSRRNLLSGSCLTVHGLENVAAVRFATTPVL